MGRKIGKISVEVIDLVQKEEEEEEAEFFCCQVISNTKDSSNIIENPSSNKDVCTFSRGLNIYIRIYILQFP